MKKKVIVNVTHQRVPAMSELLESESYTRFVEEVCGSRDGSEPSDRDDNAFHEMVFKTLDNLSEKEEIVVPGVLEFDGVTTTLRYTADEHSLPRSVSNTFVFSDPDEVTWIRNGGCESVACLKNSGERVLIYNKNSVLPTFNMTDHFINTVDFDEGGEFFCFYSAGITGLVSGKALLWVRVEFPDEG